jgi:hypothetical protein
MFKRVLHVSISKTSVATLPETRKIEVLNVCISGQTAEAHEKNRMCPPMCQVKKESKCNYLVDTCQTSGYTKDVLQATIACLAVCVVLQGTSTCTRTGTIPLGSHFQGQSCTHICLMHWIDYRVPSSVTSLTTSHM